MQHALSVRYGIIIDANDLRLDEESYNSLKLICPNTRMEVFFRSGSKRESHSRTYKDKEGNVVKTVEVRESSIPPHFVLFNQQDKVYKPEEKPLTKEKIECINAKAKQQRLKTFRRSFWRIMESNVLLTSWQENIEYGKAGFYYVYRKESSELIDQYYRNTIRYVINRLTQAHQNLMEKAIITRVEELIHLAKDDDFTAFDKFTAAGIQRVIENDFEQEMHKKISIEAFRYLMANKKNTLLIKLVQICFGALGDDSSDELLASWGSQLPLESFLENLETCRDNFKKNIKTSDTVVNIVLNRLATIIALTPWGLAFENESKRQPIPLQPPNQGFFLRGGMWHYSLSSGHNAYCNYIQQISRVKRMMRLIEPIMNGTQKEPFFMLDGISSKITGCTIHWNYEYNEIVFTIGEGYPNKPEWRYIQDKVYTLNAICIYPSVFEDFCEMTGNFLVSEDKKKAKKLTQRFKEMAKNKKLRFPCLVTLPSIFNTGYLAYKDLAKDEFAIAIALIILAIKHKKMDINFNENS